MMAQQQMPWEKDPIAADAKPLPQGGIYLPPPEPTPVEQRKESREDVRVGIAQRGEARQDASSAWTVLTPEQASREGLAPGKVYQKNGLGEVKVVSDKVDAATTERKNAEMLLRSAGVDLKSGNDRVSDLIKGSTSGRLQEFGAGLYGDVTGTATTGMENIAKLKTLVSDMTLALTGGSLGNQISNADREFIMERVGNLADASVPASARLAAWEEVKGRLARSLGDNAPSGNDNAMVGAKGAQFSTPKDEAHRARLQSAWDSGATPDEIFGLIEQDGYKVSPEQRAALSGLKPGSKVVFSAPESGVSSEAERVLGSAADSPGGAFVIKAANALLSGGMDELAPVLGLDADLVQAAKQDLGERYPVSSFVGEVAGQGLQMAGVTKALGAAGMGARGAGAAAEIGGGAAYGAGETNENRLLGAGIGAVAAGVGRKLGDVIGARLTTPEAQSAIAKVAEESGVPEAEIARVLRDLGKPASTVAEEAVSPVTETAQQKIAKLVRQATGVGPMARTARQNLAKMAKVNPEAQAAADRLGVELPIDLLSDNAQVRSLAGLARSQAGSEAESAWRTTSANVAQQADQALSDLGASTDLAQVSDDVFQRVDSSMQSLQRQASALREEVDSGIAASGRVGVPTIKAVMDEVVTELGGAKAARDVLSAEEKKLLSLAMGGSPTYARLNRIRDDIGEALSKGKGPWADVNRAALGRYYRALSDDQMAAVEAMGGAELAEKQRTANSLFKQMYDTRDEMQAAFGKKLEGSLAPLLNRAVVQGSKGDAKAINQLLGTVPEDMRGSAVLSAIMAQSRSRGAQGGFSFPNYTKLYRGLRDNSPIYAVIAKSVGTEGERILTDLYAISRRMADGEANVLKTGKANQVLASALQAESLVGGVLKATAKRAATGASASVGGIVAGPGGAFAAASMADSVQQAITNAGKTRLQKAHDLLASQEFRGLVDKLSKGEATNGAVGRVLNSGPFNRFGAAIGLKTPQARRDWFTRTMAATGAAGTVNDQEQPASPVEVVPQ